MKEKYKYLLFFLVGIVFGIFGTVLKNQEVTTQEKETIALGFVLPLTGDIAHIGNSGKKAALLAKESFLNTRYDYEFVFEDNILDNTKSASAFQKLLSIDNARAVVTIFSGAGQTLAPLGEEARIPIFNVASDMSIAQTGNYVFNHWVSPKEEACVYVKEAKKRGLKNIVLITSQYSGAYALREGLLQEDPSIFSVRDLEVSQNERDFRGLLSKLQGKNIDGFMLLLLPGQMAAAVKQIREFGFNVPLNSMETFEYDEEAIPLLNGEWYVNAGDPNNEFAERFKERYGENPQLASGNIYDIVRLLILAFEKQGNNLEKVIEEIGKTKDFPGVMGNLTSDQYGNIDSQAVVKIIRDGKFEVVE